MKLQTLFSIVVALPILLKLLTSTESGAWDTLNDGLGSECI